MLTSFQLRLMAGSLVVDGRAHRAAEAVVPAHVEELRAGSPKAVQRREVTLMLEGMIKHLGLVETIVALREVAKVK